MAHGAFPDLTFAAETLDRCSDERANPALVADLLRDPDTLVIPMRAGRLGLHSAPGSEPTLWMRSPVAGDLARLAVFLGRALGAHWTAYVGVIEPDEDSGPPAPSGVEWLGLRSIAGRIAAGEAGLVATLAALGNWHATHTHCSRCGAPTEVVRAGWVRACPVDGSEHFPRTDPAVIMAVVDDADRLLLARGAGFTASGMSVLAGFVEPGETLAATVVREVAEEVGVVVTDVEYLGDQPWPFPTGLMVGFRARALTTELRLQADEIETARWWSREEFAAALADGSLHISGRVSIARRLIEDWWGAPLDVPERTLRG